MKNDAKNFVAGITSQGEDFSRWYIDVIRKADLMDYAPVRGCIVFKPDGYELWEACQRELDRRLKAAGHRNAYFPLFIPESFFQKEKEHVEGFNPEVPWVTEVGEEKLEERLAIRPTSETIIGHMYAKWINSYRDLPVLINQWANVVRWEKRTLPFLRTSEFLWQEGHTAHASEEEARAETMKILDIYAEFVEDVLAIPVIRGKKTESEKFAGAVDTYSIEAMMKDGKALQAGTSHYLGQNFARGFEIKFLDRDNTLKYAYTTSWGVTTRLLGAFIMVHGDDRGLVIPPKIARTHAVIIPVGPMTERARVLSHAEKIKVQLENASVKVIIDAREEYSPGWKFNDHELRGVPVRVEIGPRDIESGQVVMVRRDTGEKAVVPENNAAGETLRLLEEIQANMLTTARRFFEQNSYRATTLDEMKELFSQRRGFVLAPWCGGDGCEKTVKQECGATSRNIPFDQTGNFSRCAVCGGEAKHSVWYAKSY